MASEQMPSMPMQYLKQALGPTEMPSEWRQNGLGSAPAPGHALVVQAPLGLSFDCGLLLIFKGVNTKSVLQHPRVLPVISKGCLS